MRIPSQRWLYKRGSFIPPSDHAHRGDYDVEELPDRSATARAFLSQHHYLGDRVPPIVKGYGLYKFGELCGVACFSVPACEAVITNAFECSSARDGLELGRFCLLQSCSFNSETIFLSECLRRLKKLGYAGVVAHSDPEARTTSDGRIFHRGHWGQIYAAGSAVYTGRTKARTIYLLPDGSALDSRSLSKMRAGGARYSADVLVKYGADALQDGEDPYEWLSTWLGRITRPLYHRGCHRYLFPLSHKTKIRLAIKPFPKPVLSPIN